MPEYLKVTENGQIEINWNYLETEYPEEFVQAIKLFVDPERVNAQLISIEDNSIPEQTVSYQAVLKAQFSAVFITYSSTTSFNGKVTIHSVSKSQIKMLNSLFEKEEI